MVVWLENNAMKLAVAILFLALHAVMYVQNEVMEAKVVRANVQRVTNMTTMLTGMYLPQSDHSPFLVAQTIDKV
jgi:hypothetical protein